MSAQAVSTATSSRATFGQLLDVEARRTVNNRAGFWVLAATLGVVVLGTVAVMTLGAPGRATTSAFMLDVSFPLAVGLPVVAILLVSGERTASAPALAAKAVVCASIAVAVPLLVFTLGALGAVASAASQGVDVVWDVSVGQHLRLAVFALLAMAIGFVVALVTRRMGTALGTYAVLVVAVPTLSDVAAGSLSWFATAAPWIDLPSAMLRLQDATMPGERWLHLATASLVWLVVPAAVGLLRRAVRAAAA